MCHVRGLLGTICTCIRPIRGLSPLSLLRIPFLPRSFHSIPEALDLLIQHGARPRWWQSLIQTVTKTQMVV
ncbi:hypothetical protein CIPAW_11G194600 [Carya illinoinensis]|uniref:Uncharacterized protein n=1 Tax=Carya illinoinensis TaxID=32201 RepID=A0A8T1P1I6_CARIL|nr:hypothetical protein CIPAW_11G194600 [Carya illinoinensis]